MQHNGKRAVCAVGYFFGAGAENDAVGGEEADRRRERACKR